MLLLPQITYDSDATCTHALLLPSVLYLLRKTLEGDGIFTRELCLPIVHVVFFHLGSKVIKGSLPV